jgi:hypothetical protein
VRPVRDDDLDREADPGAPWDPDDGGPAVPDATREARVRRARAALERLGDELQDATETLEEVIEELPGGHDPGPGRRDGPS